MAANSTPSKWDWQGVTSQLQLKPEASHVHPNVQQKSVSTSSNSGSRASSCQQNLIAKTNESKHQQKPQQPQQRQQQQQQQQQQQPQNKEDDIEAFSGLRIKQRTISAAEIKQEMKDRHFVKLSQTDHQQKEFFMDQETDWVTIGVLVRKTFSKAGANGDFIVWTLSDLERTELGIFLFSDAYKSHKRLEEGSVIAVLNASLMTSNERTGFAFKVTRGHEIVKLGMAKHFGICQGMASTNARCKLAVNTSKSHFCLHHIASKFLSVGKHRLQLNHAFNTGSALRLFDESKAPKNLSTGSYAAAVSNKRKRGVSNSMACSGHGGAKHAKNGILGIPTIVSRRGDITFQSPNPSKDVVNPMSSQQARLPKALLLDQLRDVPGNGAGSGSSNAPLTTSKSRGHRLVASFLGAQSAAKKPKRVDMIRFMHTGSTKQ